MNMNKKRRAARSGFTLLELMVASSLSLVVVTGVLTAFVWTVRQAALTAKIAWSQNEAMSTSTKLTMYVRNAQQILSIDESEGTWVQLQFIDGSVGRLVYSNAVPLLRDGRMYIEKTNDVQTLVARGLTEIQDSYGFTTPVFYRTRTNSLRIAYRVAEPAASGSRDANDGPYAACVRFAVCLRNAEE